MALATTNFEVGLVQLAIQNGSVYSAQRPVAPTYGLLLGKDAEMQNNIIANVPDVPTYGALSDAEIRSGILRSFVGYNTTLGADVTRLNQTATIASFTPQEVITDLAFRTTYYSDGGQYVNKARMIEGQGAGWAANVSYEQILASQLVQEYITKRSQALFAVATGSTIPTNKMPGDGSFGSLRAMISDGLTVAQRSSIGTDESNYASYAGQTRTASATTVSAQYYWAPGTGTTANATLTEAHAAAAALRGYGNGAGKLVAPMSLTRYAAFELLLRQQYGMIRIDEEMKLLVNGGRCVEFEGVTWYPDPNMPTNVTWQLLVDVGTPGMPNAIARTAMQKSNIELVPAATLNAADRLRWVFPDQAIVRNPKACVLIEGLTAL
jgi:hypothetical protein